MAKIEDGGHQLVAEHQQAFDGDGHELLNCRGCGLRMSRKAAENGFWQKFPCDEKGVGVTMVTGSERVERYTVIEMMPHTWKSRKQAAAEAEAEPQPLFGNEEPAQAEEPEEAGDEPSIEAAQKLATRVLNRLYRQKHPALEAARVVVQQSSAATDEQRQAVYAEAKTAEERAALEQLAAS